MTEEPLFPGYEPAEPYAASPDPDEGLSAGQRLTRRQKRDVANGRHPLTGGPLHPEASTDAEPGPRSAPFTCGSCVHRDADMTRFPKCVKPGPDGKPIRARLTHSAATDVRAWWPCCPDYEPTPTG